MSTDRKRAVLALLSFAMLIVSLDQYIVIVALPEIGRDLDFTGQTLQAVVSAYAIASAGFLLLGGRAADLLGRRRVLVAGLTLYGIASLCGGLAPAPEVLLVARAAQGLSGALVFPATLTLVNTTFAEGRERNRAVAVWGGAGAAGLVIGVLLGGLLTRVFGWEAVFFVNVPLVALSIAGALTLIPQDRQLVRGRGFDALGALATTLGVTSFVFALVEGPNLGWTSPLILGSAALSVILLTGLVFIERRSRDPLIPPRLFTNRNVTTAIGIAFMFMATFGAVLFFLSLYFQDVHGYDALQTGAAFLVPTVVVVLGSVVAGQLASRIGLKATLVGALAVGAVGAALLGFAMSEDSTYLALVPGLIGISLGDGIVFTSMFIAAGTGVSDSDQGVAAGITSTASGVGATVGLAVLVLIADLGSEGLDGAALADGLSTAVIAVGIGIAATILFALRLGVCVPGRSRTPCPRGVSSPVVELPD